MKKKICIVVSSYNGSTTSKIYLSAKKNKNIFFLSADFGAPALDRFRRDLKNQFIHCGISEQNMVFLDELKQHDFFLSYFGPKNDAFVSTVAGFA